MRRRQVEQGRSVRHARFAAFLRLSLFRLRREQPTAFARLCATLAPRAVELDVDGETVSIRAERGSLRVGGRVHAPDVRLRTRRSVIRDVIGGRCLVEAILADDVLLAGPLEDLVAFHDGLMLYVHGAVRSPSFPDLLALFGVDRRDP